jgi:hypothetical protein
VIGGFGRRRPAGACGSLIVGSAARTDLLGADRAEELARDHPAGRLPARHVHCNRANKAD